MSSPNHATAILIDDLIGSGFIGFKFVASGDNGEFQLQAELPKETPLEQTNFLIQQIENKLLNDPNVINVFTTDR